MPVEEVLQVTELAKMKRNELREFKRRFLLSLDKSRVGSFVLPYRIFVPRTACGFLFIPLDSGMLEYRRIGLENLTHACKYDFKAAKCIGITFAPDGPEWYSVEWCYLEYPWQRNQELEDRIQETHPFRPVKTTQLGRYSFKGD